MKRILIILFFTVTLIQTGYSLKIDIGGKGGIGFGTVEVGGDAQRLIFHGGIGGTVELGLTDLIALEANVMYMAKGGDLIGSTILFDYLQTPVLAKFYLLDKFYLGAGANIGLAFNSSYSGSTSGFDLGLLLATGYKVPVTADNDWFVTFDFWYDMGLLDVASDSETFKNRSYVLYLGVLYRFQG